MSGEVYDIAKRAVHAYINTGSIPQYVATQVERDVTALMEKKIREAKAAAWDECANLPSRPTLEDNPYRTESSGQQMSLRDLSDFMQRYSRGGFE